MDEKTALHTAARRYCVERDTALHPLFWERLEERLRQEQRDVSDRELRRAAEGVSGTAAQWEMLGAILFGLEQVTPEDFPDIEALRAELVAVAREAEPDLAGWSEQELPELEEERELFRAYVERLCPDDLRAVEPLFHRRVLSDHDADKLWRRAKRRWGVPREWKWYPMNDGDPPAPNILAFTWSEFSEHVPTPTLHRILAARRIRRLWELQWDYDTVYEIDLDIFRPGGPETYWTSEPMDWIVYTSHEDSITIGGEWLLNLVRREWPDCDGHLRTTHLPPAVLRAEERWKSGVR
ncbi:MAG: hypothetical protein JOZ41_11750 [Chloroflexi bacterium]|nr:hypothetical protein [Chloroflexota bacterium]